MNRVRKSTIFGLMLLLIFLLCAAVGACAKRSSNALATPENVRFEDEILSWDKVEGATSYLVSLNEDEYTVEGTSFDTLDIITKPGTYRMSVIALGDMKTTFDSVSSEEIEYTVADPSPALLGIKTDGGYLMLSDPEVKLTGKLLLPSNIVGIYKSGFADCTGITSVYIPDNVSVIQGGAFAGCTNLRRVRLPENFDYQTIESNTFSNCTSLWDIAIPESVQTIKVGAFRNCTAFKEIFIPASVTTLAINGYILSYPHVPFAGCTAERVTVAEENPVYYSEDNCILTREGNVLVAGFGSVIPESAKAIGEFAFLLHEDLESIEIPVTIEEIRQQAFRGCSNLKSIAIPGTVKVIESQTFLYCSNLQSVEIGEGVETIGETAFCSCTKLASIEIPEGVKEIGRNAFQDCSQLTAINIPKSVEKLDGTAFNYCSNLTSLTVAEGNPVYYSAENCIILREGNILVLGGGGSVIPEGVEEIGKSAFRGSGIAEVTIPASVKKIGEYAFYACHNLRSVRLPEGLETIGDEAFNSCGPFSLVIPESVTEMGKNAISLSVTVFTSCLWEDRPEGWHGNWGGDTRFWGCTLGHDGAYPYVISTAYLEHDSLSNNIVYLIGRNYVCAPERSGYTFAGWATEEGGEVVYEPYMVTVRETDTYKQEALVSFDCTGDRFAYITITQELKGKTLYAVWIPNE